MYAPRSWVTLQGPPKVSRGLKLCCARPDLQEPLITTLCGRAWRLNHLTYKQPRAFGAGIFLCEMYTNNMHFQQFKAPVPEIDLAQLCLSGASHPPRASWRRMGARSWRRQLEREAARALGMAPAFPGTFVICIIGNLITGRCNSSLFGEEALYVVQRKKTLSWENIAPSFSKWHLSGKYLQKSICDSCVPLSRVIMCLWKETQYVNRVLWAVTHPKPLGEFAANKI